MNVGLCSHQGAFFSTHIDQGIHAQSTFQGLQEKLLQADGKLTFLHTLTSFLLQSFTESQATENIEALESEHDALLLEACRVRSEKLR